MSAGAVGEYAFHVHHEVLFEKLTEPLQNRIDYVKAQKNRAEIPLRLKLMRVVKDQSKLSGLAAALETAWKGYDKGLTDTAAASKAKDDKGQGKAEGAVGKAYQDALVQNQAIYALHKLECEPDCPWDGRSIFGKV